MAINISLANNMTLKYWKCKLFITQVEIDKSLTAVGCTNAHLTSQKATLNKYANFINRNSLKSTKFVSFQQKLPVIAGCNGALL